MTRDDLLTSSALLFKHNDMSKAAELRAKLLAQRAAQQEEAHRREVIHDEAKLATKQMVMLGYNFDDILELSETKVSESHLNVLFRTIGIYRKRKFSRDTKPTPFGASRWLDRREDFIIDMDEDTSDDKEETDSEGMELETPKTIPDVATPNLSGDTSYELPVNDYKQASNDQENHYESRLDSGDTEFLSVSMQPVQSTQTFVQDKIQEPSDEHIQASMEKESDMHVVNTQEDAKQNELHRQFSENQLVSNLPNEIDHKSGDSPKNREYKEYQENSGYPEDRSHNEAEESLNEEEATEELSQLQQFHKDKIQKEETKYRDPCFLPLPCRPFPPSFSHSQESLSAPKDGLIMNESNKDDSEHEPVDRSEAASPITGITLRDEPQAEPQAKHQAEPEVEPEVEFQQEYQNAPHSMHPPRDKADLQNEHHQTEQHPDNRPSNEMDIDQPPLSNETKEQNVQKELKKIQEQIREMQQRKQARNAQKEADAEMARRNMELRDIASRRALLAQKKERLSIEKHTQRISELERLLAIAKGKLEETSAQLQGIDVETQQLEQQEIKLREELSRPRQAITEKTVFVEEVEVGTAADSDEINETQQEVATKYPFLTAKDSPLMMFSSFRMCPSVGPGHWFSKSFNSRFIPNLESRTFCPTEMASKKSRCTEPQCEYVHFRDFDIPALEICKYMGTRHIDRPEFRDGLMKAIESHLDGPEVPVEQLAATIIGYCKQYDPSQILDWESWQVQRPL